MSVLDKGDRQPGASVAHMYSAFMHNSLPAEDIREHVRKEVDTRRAVIRKLHEEVAEFQSVHNSAAPINTLPPELLSMIFSHVETACAENADLISVTHVCRHWRDLALHAPVLWTRIALKHPEGVRTFLDRSKTLPLRVSLQTDQLPIVATVRTLTADIHRTRTLKVRIPPSRALEVVTQKLLTATPLLEELFIERLQVPPGTRRASIPLPDGPPTEFDGAPMLRSLTLHGMRLPYLPIGPSALTNICLEGSLPTPETLLSLLERCPFLQEFRIQGPFNEDSHVDSRKVILEHLQTLQIYSYPPEGIALFLPSLVLPAQTNITLNASLDLGEDFSEIIAAYNAGLPLEMESLRGLKRLQLVWTHHELSLQAYRGQDDFHTPALHISTFFLEPRPGPRFFGNWPIDTAHIETLVLCGSFSRRHPYDFAIRPERWTTMLPALPALKTLRVMSVCNETLEHLTAELAAERPQPWCPHLEALDFYDVFPRTQFWDGLLDVLHRRSPEAGGALARLELFNVQKPPEWQGTLETLNAAGVSVSTSTD